MKALRLRNAIEALVEIQKNQKEQRKTVRFVGERTIDSDEAQIRVPETRHRLRLMYAAYGLLRGKSYSQIESHYDESNHPLKEFDNAILKIMEEYNEEVVCSDRQTA